MPPKAKLLSQGSRSILVILVAAAAFSVQFLLYTTREEVPFGPSLFAQAKERKEDSIPLERKPLRASWSFFPNFDISTLRMFHTRRKTAHELLLLLL